MKRITGIFCILSLLCLLASLFLPLLGMRSAGEGSLGIIGGADTPTYRVIYRESGMVYLTLLGLLGGLVSVVAFLRFRNKK
ncbi:MAG: hypothetical protein IJX28_00930 [Clostridia bacterium]|nr:hypothetical protein [Clostridia bacterium]